MRKSLFSVALLVCIVLLASCDRIGNSHDGLGIGEDQCVDLGLSVNWAGYNLGCNSPFRLGETYPWGQTKPNITANAAKITPNTTSADISGNAQYDPATKCWGNGWRTPTREDWEELLRRCKWQQGTFQGYEGYKVTGPNGNSIFFPARTVMDEVFNEPRTDYGTYWTSTSSETQAMTSLPQLRIDEDGSAHEMPVNRAFIDAYSIDLFFVQDDKRYIVKKELKTNCFYIRPVCDKEQ